MFLDRGRISAAEQKKRSNDEVVKSVGELKAERGKKEQSATTKQQSKDNANGGRRYLVRTQMEM